MDESEIKTPQFGRVSNPEFEVGTLNMKTDDVNDCLSNPDIFSLHVVVPTSQGKTGGRVGTATCRLRYFPSVIFRFWHSLAHIRNLSDLCHHCTYFCLCAICART